jgi:hypothetical protein
VNITEEVNKLIVKYFERHDNIINSHDIKHEMIHDRDAQLDAIELVCDIANVYNSAIYQCAFDQLEKALKTPIEKIGTVSAHTNSLTPQDIDRLADAVYWDSCHIRRD